jgi:hypothetical protein
MIDDTKPKKTSGAEWVYRAPPAWKKGQSGNPRGVNGSTYRNKAAVVAETLVDDEGEVLIRKCIEFALQGDANAMKLCIERLLPPRRVRPVKFALPELHSIADAQAALAKLVDAVCRGEVLSDEALAVTEIINSFTKVLAVSELESRLAALEQAESAPPAESPAYDA